MTAMAKVIDLFDDPGDAEVLDGIHKLPEAFLECRTLGHAWKLVYLGPMHSAPRPAQEYARRSIYNPDGCRVTRCSRCRTRRLDLFLFRFGSALPAFLGRTYLYPDAYHIAGSGTYRANMVDELFRRHWTEEDADGDTAR